MTSDSGVAAARPAVTPATRARYRRILRFAGWNLAVTWWYELLLPRIGLAGVAARTRSRRMRRFAQRFHVLAVDLGGLMIKVGQFMSSRLDVLPPEITSELEGLQDEVPAVPFPAIRALAESELGVPLEQAFASIDAVPVAAASLGQAHRATLTAQTAEHTGLVGVVLKVQRPGIDAIVDVDLAALRRVGRWLSHVRLVSDRVDAPALVEEFARTSLEEIDYLHEAANSERFAEEFDGDERVAGGVQRVDGQQRGQAAAVGAVGAGGRPDPPHRAGAEVTGSAHGRQPASRDRQSRSFGRAGRRMRDSNSRGVAPNTLSKRAP